MPINWLIIWWRTTNGCDCSWINVRPEVVYFEEPSLGLAPIVIEQMNNSEVLENFLSA
jgi:hypothetical protein